MLKRLKFDISPLANDMLDKIPLSEWESETSTFLDPAMGGAQFIRPIINRLRDHGHSDENIKGRVSGIENGQLRVNFAVNKYGLIGTYMSTDFLSWETDMKFDNIIINPPYQAETDGNSRPIWDKFINKSISLLKEGGHLCAVHPAGWRNVDGRFTDTRDLLLSKQMEYLEIHNVKDGIKTFGAITRYDWYLVKNSENSSNKTFVVFEDGSSGRFELTSLPFIPNHSIEKITSLIAQSDEEKVEIISNSTYHTQRNYVSTQESQEFKYPLISRVRVGLDFDQYWSSRNDIGHFGVPKIVISLDGTTGVYSDLEGKYGLTQFSWGIVDDPDNLTQIKKVFDDPIFRDLMKATTLKDNMFNHKVISLFRKDFWKEFV